MAAFEHNTWRAGLDRVLLGRRDERRRPPPRRARPARSTTSAAPTSTSWAASPSSSTGSTPASPHCRPPRTRRRGWARSPTACAAWATWRPTTPGSWPSSTASWLRAAAAAATDGPGVRLRLADVRALLVSRLGGRPTRANFRTGTLTVCTMVPMRSVPHRVVCLVGLDDGVFPRSLTPDGDDVLARDPLTGERDVRSEDRQLLLDALLAATETLVVTYTGANEHSGAPRPARGPAGRGARRRRPHLRRPGARQRADPPPAAALRRPQPDRRRRCWSTTRGPSASTPRRWAGPGPPRASGSRPRRC